MLYKKTIGPSYRLIQGFSLVELLVSISIIVLVAGVVVARNNAFESAVLLRNQAYLVASTIREAQLEAVSGTSDTANVRPVGVYIDRVNENQQVIIFRDTDPGTPNRRYSTADEILSLLRLDRRFVISDIEYGNNERPDNISITFLRPNYDASFKRGNNTEFAGPVSITITDTRGQTRVIEVNAAGQVSVI